MARVDHEEITGVDHGHGVAPYDMKGLPQDGGRIVVSLRKQRVESFGIGIDKGGLEMPSKKAVAHVEGQRARPPRADLDVPARPESPEHAVKDEPVGQAVEVVFGCVAESSVLPRSVRKLVHEGR